MSTEFAYPSRHELESVDFAKVVIPINIFLAIIRAFDSPEAFKANYVYRTIVHLCIYTYIYCRESFLV